MDQAKTHGVWMLMTLATAAGCGASVSTTDAAVVPADAPLQDAGCTNAGSVLDAAMTDAAGDAASESDACPVPTNAPDASAPYVVELAVGAQDHQCARMSDGTVRCRGINSDGQLGIGNSDRGPFESTTVPGLTDVEQVVTINAGVTCTRLRDGQVRCWGSNEYGLVGVGQNGDQNCGSYRCRTSPVLVPGLTDVAFLAASASTVCAVKLDGSLWCWGGRSFLSSAASTRPRLVPDVTDVAGLWPRGGGFLVRYRDGHYESEETIGSGVPDEGIIEGAAPSDHVCYLLPDGTTRCSGLNADGKIGNGLSRWPGDVTEPFDPGLRGVRSVVTGRYHTCAIVADRTVSCWGANDYNTLGVETTETCAGISQRTPCATRPTPVRGIDNVEQLFLGLWGTCAMRIDHSVWCWGDLSPLRSRVPDPVAW